MEDDKSTLSINKETPVKKPKKRFASQRKELEIFETNNTSWIIRLRLGVFVIFACLSSITVAAKIRFTPVISHALSVHFNNKFPQNQMEWIGRLYAIIVLCLLPVTTAIMDHWMIGYRFALVISGTMHLIACITNSTVTHPLFFVLTDSFVCGLGSAITFSVFLLAIDDMFPSGNRFRVLATTLCQGSTIGSLFVLDLLAVIAKDWGWMILQMSLAVIFSVEAIALIVTCPEYGIKVRVKRRGGPRLISSLDEHSYTSQKINETKSIESNKLLGLTFKEMSRSPSMFPFLVYRFSMNIIHQGIFMLVLIDSHIITTPDIETLLSKFFAPTLAALVYASGEASVYILGAIFGYFLLGYLLHVSIIFLCVLFLVTVIWQPIRLQMMSQSMIIGHVVCAGITGACIGGLNTCMMAVSEEGTMLRSRKIYPFVKLLEGLAYTFSPFLFKILNRVSEQNIWLLTFAVMSAANACMLVFILHKLYTKYLTDSNERKTSIQVSMKPARFFTKGCDSS